MKNIQIILIVGASGAGKDSLLKEAKRYFEVHDYIYNTDSYTLPQSQIQHQAMQNFPKVHFIPRYIDRKPDRSEQNFYIDSASFEILEHFFISKWQANGYNYGIAKHSLQEGVNIISISRGAIWHFEKHFQQVSVIEVFVPEDILRARLESRQRENAEEIEQRLKNASKKINAKNLYRFDNSGVLENNAKIFIKLIHDIFQSNNHIQKPSCTPNNYHIKSSCPHTFFTPHNNPSKILHFLGSSNSSGIPVHNCSCIACTTYRAQRKRNLATSAFLQTNAQEFILLDCGIEEIANLFDRLKIKAVFLTHFHADHALGLLRLRYSADKIACYHPQDTQGFGDLFKHTKSIQYHILEPFKPVSMDGFTFIPIPLIHSKPTFGYFIKSATENIAYLTDCANIPQESLEFLTQQCIDICYIDAGALYKEGRKDSPNHLSAQEAQNILNILQAKTARFIHISHNILTHYNQQELLAQSMLQSYLL